MNPPSIGGLGAVSNSKSSNNQSIIGNGVMPNEDIGAINMNQYFPAIQ